MQSFPEPLRRHVSTRRRGAISVLAAFWLVIVIAMAAFAIDLGYLMVARTDLQRAADAAAHAAVLEYRSQAETSSRISNVRNTAQEYVESNPILKSTASVSLNHHNADPNGDIVVGRIDFEDPRAAMTFGNPDSFNAVRVRIRRTNNKNGAVSLFFARVLGHRNIGLEAEATAAIVKNIGGFKIPTTGENAPILPITIEQEFWEEAIEDGDDDWAYNNADQTISEESDDIPEVRLFPNKTGSSGNFGTVNIGTSANSTSFLSNQIRKGVTQADLDYHGGELKLDAHGELLLSGDPGLSAGIKNNLKSIAGKAVVIPLYRKVTGSGSTAQFVIVEFVGVRIMSVQLNGGEKYVAVQPANVTYRGTIQSEPGQNHTSQQIYSPPVIVQ